MDPQRRLAPELAQPTPRLGPIVGYHVKRLRLPATFLTNRDRDRFLVNIQTDIPYTSHWTKPPDGGSASTFFGKATHVRVNDWSNHFVYSADTALLETDTVTNRPFDARVWVFCMTLFVAPIGESASGDDWPGWRGPARSGVSSEIDIPVRWSATDGIRWKTPVPGLGVSSPIILKDRVVLTASDGPDQSELLVMCLAREDGRRLWLRKLWGTAPTLYHGSKSSMATPTPVTDGRHLFAFFGTGDAFCLDLDGRLIWHRSLASEYGRFENRFAASSSPLLHGDLLLLQCDHYGSSYLVALDKRSGANRWKTDRPEAWLSWSSPILAPVDAQGAVELVVCGSHKIDAFDPKTGNPLWTVKGMRRECIPTPVLGNGLIYAVSGPKGPTLAIKPGGRGDVTDTHVVWSNKRGAPFVPSAILVGNRYYLVDDAGIATCLDVGAGKRLWQKRLPGAYTASPIAADHRVYFVNEAGLTIVVDATTDHYVELARNEIGEPVYASPSLSQGDLYLRGVRHLYCIGGK